jgi:hypothetical protein
LSQLCGFSESLNWDAAGVGQPRDEEQSVSTVRGSNVGSADTRPERIVPALGQVPENISHSPSQERCDVLHDDDSRS